MSRTPAKFRRMRPILFGKQKCTVAFAPWSMNGSGRGLTRMGVNRHPPGTSSELHGPFRPYWSTRRNTKRALNSPQDQQFRNYSSANHTRFLTNGTTSSWRQPRKQVDTSLPLWRATGRQACASPALSGAVAIFWLADHAGEHQSLVSAGVCTSVRRARTAAQLIDLAAERLLKWRFDGPCWQNDANRKHRLTGELSMYVSRKRLQSYRQEVGVNWVTRHQPEIERRRAHLYARQLGTVDVGQQEPGEEVLQHPAGRLTWIYKATPEMQFIRVLTVD